MNIFYGRHYVDIVLLSTQGTWKSGQACTGTVLLRLQCRRLVVLHYYCTLGQKLRQTYANTSRELNAKRTRTVLLTTYPLPAQTNRLMVQGSGADYKKRKRKKKKRKGKEGRKEMRRKGKRKGEKEGEKEGLRRPPVRLLVDAVFALLVAARRRL
jgi:hypothetical protein